MGAPRNVARRVRLAATLAVPVVLGACNQDQPLSGSAPPPATLPSFTIKDLGLLPGGTQAQANAGTNSLIVGWASDAAGAHHAVKFVAGNAAPLTEPASTDSSEARGISSTGMIAGVAYSSGTSLALLWTSSTAAPIVLPTLGGTNASARAVNAAGVVHGWSEDAKVDTVPVFWGANHSVQVVDTALHAGDPTALNDSGFAAGNTPNSGYFWTPAGGLTEVQTIGLDEDVNGLNNTGIVVGRFLTNDSLNRAFRWTDVRGMVRLGEPPAGYSQLAGGSVNDQYLVAATASNVNASGNITASVVAITTALETLRQFAALPTLGGAQASASDGGMTPCGTIVGWALPSGSPSRHAVAWIPTGCTVP